jgi:hypothetical protein
MAAVGFFNTDSREDAKKTVFEAGDALRNSSASPHGYGRVSTSFDVTCFISSGLFMK